MVLFQRAIVLIFIGTFFVYSQDHSINFDGSNDYIRISDHADLDLTQNYTLEAWIFLKHFPGLQGSYQNIIRQQPMDIY